MAFSFAFGGLQLFDLERDELRENPGFPIASALLLIFGSYAVWRGFESSLPGPFLGWKSAKTEE